MSREETKRLYFSYFTGFLWSLLLTLAAFALVKMKLDSVGEA